MIHTVDRFQGNETELKRTYAQYVYEGLSPFNAAMRIYPDDGQFAFWVYERWANDPFVKEEIDRLKRDKKLEYEPPSKLEMAKEIYEKTKAWNGEAYLKGMRLVADMLGYVEKPAQNTGPIINNTQVNPVMIVKDLGDQDSWQIKAREQQRRLKQPNVIEHDA